jgi:hypothetical protein
VGDAGRGLIARAAIAGPLCRGYQGLAPSSREITLPGEIDRYPYRPTRVVSSITELIDEL